MQCLLQVGNESLPQVKEFKHLGILFISEGTIACEIDRRILMNTMWSGRGSSEIDTYS